VAIGIASANCHPTMICQPAEFCHRPKAHNSYIWTFAIEHNGEHYCQLLVYYRANNLVSRTHGANAVIRSSKVQDCNSGQFGYLQPLRPAHFLQLFPCLWRQVFVS